MVLEAECPEYLESLGSELDGNMGLIMSVWEDPDGVTDIDDGEFKGCENYHVGQFENFRFLSTGSNERSPIDVEEGAVVFGDIADDVSKCGSECSECITAHYENWPEMIMYKCIDYSKYKFKQRCGDTKDKSMCGENDICHWSYPYGDVRREKSRKARCRPVPKKLSEDGPFQFCKVPSKGQTWGLCKDGCGEQEECRNSWLADDQ